jgi:NAD(P)-dependent dehydrogenase (short-subunit alcohol dehydrogenase family)
MGKDRLIDKIALVTGAGNGVGCATTKLYADEGARVIAVDISGEALEQWQGKANVIPVQADITKQEDIDRMVGEAEKRFSRLDILCNIAGVNDLSYPLTEVEDALWDRLMEVDLKAPFRICRRVVPLMLAGGGGSIINIGSYAAIRGNHGPTYTAAKAGVVGLTRSIAFAYGGRGLRCNVVNPGGLKTDIGAHSGGNYHPEGQAPLSAIMKALPVKWYGEPEDIAKLMLWLGSDESKYINGAVIAADGGMSCC